MDLLFEMYPGEIRELMAACVLEDLDELKSNHSELKPQAAMPYGPYLRAQSCSHIFSLLSVVLQVKQGMNPTKKFMEQLRAKQIKRKQKKGGS